MELALATAIGVLTAIGIYLLLRARSFDVILGMTFLSYATNLLIFAGGRVVQGKAPVLQEGVDSHLGNYTDPLPQALVLTAIVIAFAMTAVTIVLAMGTRVLAANGSVYEYRGIGQQGQRAPLFFHAEVSLCFWGAVPRKSARRRRFITSQSRSISPMIAPILRGR